MTFTHWREKPTALDWSLLIGVQILDIWSTRRALKYYPCVKEQNPFLPDNPTVQDMAELKLLAGSWIWFVRDDLEKWSLYPAIGLTSAVVINNVVVRDRAKRKC